MPSTYNDDVAGLYDRLDRFVQEIQTSQSANVPALRDFDKERLLAYLEEIDAFVSWVQSRPYLDLPKTSPELRTLRDPVPEIPLDNPMMMDLQRLLSRARDEILNGQSTRWSTGLISFDANRITSITAKGRSYITDYVSQVNPLDMPETNTAPVVTKGGPAGKKAQP